MLLPIKLSENKEVPSKIQILKTGEFYQEDGKKVKVTKEMLASFVENFKNKVRGYEDGQLPIDYFHENEKVAAGWMKDVSLEADGEELWAEVKWTPKGAQKLSDGELRYISVEFHFNYQHNEGEKKFGPTLFGAGLTNRPFIKGMEPITMFDEEKSKMKDMNEALAEIKKLNDKIADLEKANGDMKKKMSDDAEKAEADKKLAEKKGTFDKMLAEGKVVEAQREAFVANDMVKFSELAKPTNLGGQGNGGQGAGGGNNASKTAQDEVLELAEKEVKENKVSLSDGIRTVLGKNKELNARYLKEVSIS